MIKDITTENVKQMISEEDYVILDLVSNWCNPCKVLSPILEKMSLDMTDISFVKMDVEENPDIAIEYNIKSVPTLLFFKNGEHVLTHVGMIPEKSLLEKITKIKNG